MVLIPRDQLGTFLPVKEAVHNPTVPAIGVEETTVFIVGKQGVDLNALLPPLKEGTAYHMVSRGHWSLHEMMSLLLSRIGPAHVSLASWGITQEPLNKVLRLARTGAISALDLYFDSRVKLQCPQAWQLILAAKSEGLAIPVRVGLSKNHSKVIILRNAEWGIVVSGSANLTDNPRQEYYVVTVNAGLAAASFAEWFDKGMRESTPFNDTDGIQC